MKKRKKTIRASFVCFSICCFVFTVLSGCTKSEEISGVDSLSTNDLESNVSNEMSDITEEKEGYTMEVNYKEDGKFDFSITPKEQVFNENPFYQPFQNIFEEAVISGTVDPNRAYSSAATIQYTKRDGAFIYCNNPEKLSTEDVGQALLRNYEMQGDYFFTFEHSNYTEAPFYLGYQLLNTGDTDATVTVTNIGLQVKGEWLGQKSWSDFYNYKFTLPDDYFRSNGTVNPIYFGCDYINYTPRVFQPVTVTIPAGEYIYVLGGTTADASQNTNIGATGNLSVGVGSCANGAVRFNVEGGTIQGTFYCYSDASQVHANPAEQGYIVSRNDVNYAAQYKGTDYEGSLIESTITFVVNDKTRDGKLPVKYEKSYDPSYATKTVPFQEYSMTTKNVVANEWQTSLNPNSASDAIGTDMMNFAYIDIDGNPITIDNNHTDGVGEPANTGNWMVQYTDNFNLVNTGNTPKTFKIYKKGATSGALLTMVRNDKGEILDARMKANPYYFESLEAVFEGVNKNLLIEKNGTYWFKVADGRAYCDVVNERALVYEITVAPMSMERISVDYLIMGNSNGGISHWVEVADAVQ